MKGNTFKKTVAALASVAMVAQLGFIIPASAEELRVETLDSNYIVTVTDEGNTLTIPITNNSNEESTVTAYIATYSGDTLKSIALDTAEINADGNETLNLDYTAPGAGESVKLFIWDEDNAPIIKALTVAEGEETAPTEETTAAPTEEVTAAPSEEATETPTEETTDTPSEEATETPTEETTDTPTEEVTETPTEETTETPTEEVTDTPTEEVTEQPTGYHTWDYTGVTTEAEIVNWATANNTVINDAKGPTISIANSDVEGIGDYLLLGTDSGAGGNRAIMNKFMADYAITDGKAVLEFDFSMSNGADRVNEFMICSANTAIANNTTYTGTDYILKFDQPVGGGRIIINDNTLGDTATSSDVAAQFEYENNTWLHVKALIDMSERTVSLAITDYNTGDNVYTGMLNIGATADKIGGIHAAPARNGSGTISLDNFLYRTATEDDEMGRYYTVTYDVNGNTTTESVAEGGYVLSIPDTENPGYKFDGWKVGDSEELISTEALAQYAITADTKFTASYSADTDYIEPIVSSVIEGSTLMTIGADADTSADNVYKLVLTGERGTVITADTLDPKVTDFKVDWDIDGFKTSNDGDGQYCDSYGNFAEHEDNATEVTFELRKNASMNFFGMLTATVIYNGSEIEVKLPVAAISDTSSNVSQVLPEGGYPSDIDEYPDSLIGYKTVGETYDGSDLIVGGWNMAGSDTAKSAEIMQEDANKFIRISCPTYKKSHMFSNKIDSPATQVIFEQDVRFNGSRGDITFTGGYAFWQDKGYSVPISLSFDGTNLLLNNVVLTKDENPVIINKGVWYKIVLSSDKTTETCFANVYDAEGELVASSGSVKWTESSTPVYYNIGMANEYTGTVDFDNYKAFYATPDTESFTLESTQKTLSIPNGDSADLTASIKSTEGYDITGTAIWSVLESDMAAGIQITPDETNSHKAHLSLTDNAVPGTATIQVNIGGYTKTVELQLTSSAESIKFTESSSSVSIPLDTSKTTEVKYAATVVNGSGEDLNRQTTLAVYDRTNTVPYTLPEGITFDPETGILTVNANAVANTFTIRATGENTDGESISRGILVNVHGLAFDFGSGEKVAEGYTSITSTTAYTDENGYGITGSPVAGGTASEDDADSDYLEGNMVFKAKVQSAKLYTVEITYRGSILAEPVNAELTGYTIGSQEELSKATYTVPVIDDVIELNVTALEGSTAQIASIVITKQADKEPAGKPTLFTVGDSTISNNGSWAYYITHNTDKYQDLYNLVDFQNNGRGGSNLNKYYNSGDFYNRILTQIKPGDIMMIGDMGTNGGATPLFEDNFNYFIDAAEALGAKIIINSYSPHGAVKTDDVDYTYVYDSETHTFSGCRTAEYDVIARKIAEEREATDENYLGFVDIGKMADASFNNYIRDYEANGYASIDDAANAIIECFADQNHYSGLATELMNNGYGDSMGTVKAIIQILNEYLKVE